jgi:uncharacterized protein YecT (DUF1311 family)
MSKFTQGCFIVILMAILLYPDASLAQSQADLNLQAESDFAKSDAQLNVVYQKLITKLDATSTAKLRASQRAWLAFRDAQAEFKADLDARDGSMYRQIYAGIEKAITDKRMADLQDLIDNDTNR